MVLVVVGDATEVVEVGGASVVVVGLGGAKVVLIVSLVEVDVVTGRSVVG